MRRLIWEMQSHVPSHHGTVSDLNRAPAFYDAILTLLGLRQQPVTIEALDRRHSVSVEGFCQQLLRMPASGLLLSKP